MARTNGTDASALTVSLHLHKLQRISLKEIRPSFGRFSHDYGETLRPSLLSMVNDLGSVVCVGANSPTLQACLMVSDPSVNPRLLDDV